MIGELIDSAVSVFSPAAAAKRAYARGVYNSVRNYEAARVDRRSNDWRAQNRSADAEMLADADAVRARARDLVRNNAYARGIIRAAVRNIVAHGIRPQARVETARGKQNEQFNSVAEALWHSWQRRCDITGRMSFYELQQLVVSERWEAGECLIRFVSDESDRSRPLPLALQVIDADLLVSDDYLIRRIGRDTGNDIRRGVEVDATGRPVAYWLYTSHPNDSTGRAPHAKRYDASEFLHLFRPQRVGQTRGMSEFSTVVWWAKGLHRYVSNEQTAKEVSSCFTTVIKTLDGAASGGLLPPSGEEAVDANGNAFERIEPGMVARVMPGEDVTVVNPARGETESAAWINLMLRSMGVGTGLSYERLTRDYSQTNYSSNRAGDLEDRREFRMEQQWLIEHLCRPVWEKVIASAVEHGVRGFPSADEFIANYDRWTEHCWFPPGWEWVDPDKEQRASREAVAGDLSTLAAECGAHGDDWRDVMRQRAIERAYKQELDAEFGLVNEDSNAGSHTTDAVTA